MTIAQIHNTIKRVIFVLILSFVFLRFSSSKISAAVFSCEVSVSPHTTTRETSTVYSFTVDSASYTGSGIRWLKVTRPSGEFTITNITASGWSNSSNDTDATLTNPDQTIPPNFTVYATSGSNDAASADWVVEMSSTEAGDSPRTCTGSLGTSISGSSSVTPTPTPTFTPIPDTSAPTISNVVVSGVSESSVTISWNTNESATTRLNYGTTTSYGSDKTNSGTTTSHSVTLTGLSVNTTYHAQIQSADGAGNTATSNDFTFATSQTVTTITVSTTVIITPTATPTPTPDVIRPKVSISTKIDKIFVEVPVIEGTATDNESVSTVEYSIDDGKNWAKADQIVTPGEKQASFSFKPLTQGDGNYLLKVRAIDANNNQAETETQQFIIDRLPPLMGGALFSIGSQVLEPDQNGTYFTVAGITPKLTFSAVGGPTTINLKVNNQMYPLTQNLQTRLWSAGFVVNEVGTYTLQLDASDAAKNTTVKHLPTLTTLANGIVSDSVGPVSNAQIRVHYFDTPSQSFRLWGAEQYGQENPTFTDSIGRYTLMLPPGTYYLDITSPHTRPLKTNIFSVTKTTPITQNFFLMKKNGVKIGSYILGFPDFGQNDVNMDIDRSVENETRSIALVGQAFPDFNLSGVTQNSIKGEPHLVTILATWLPQTAAQMSVLESMNVNLKSLVIMSQESSASVQVFAKRGEYQVPIISDPDGILIEPLQLKSLPTHYFLDARGVVTKVVSGVLSKEEIERVRLETR